MFTLRRCLAICWLVAVPASATTWYESYDQAEAALARESWSEAVRHLNAALELKQDSSIKSRTYGMRFVDYLPYLKLGVAYYHLGQADAAAQAFETETRQGAVARSRVDLALLESYRQRILDDRAREKDERGQRARQIVDQNLGEAQRLEQQGRFEDALASLDRTLAVAPENPQAQAAQQRLRSASAAREQQRQVAERRARLLSQAKSELAADQLRQAAASASEALELLPGEDAEALLREAQARLRAEIEQRQNVEDRSRLLSQSLRRAGELADADQPEAALAELQTVLALEPDNPAARELHRRLLAAHTAAEESGTQNDAIAELLSATAAHLEDGEHEQALRTANRALALQPNQATALRHIARAYAGLSESLLSVENTPPTLLLDVDPPDSGGSALQRVRQAEVTLTGTVYDSTPVEVLLLEGGQPVGQVSVQEREFRGVWITEFRWQHRIDTGRSSFEVVATDDAGNRVTTLYDVEYARPFLRSVRFPASIAAGLALLAVGLIAVRSRRRKRLLRERFNPYIAGAPILEQSRFFGRQQLLDYVLRRIGNNCLMLYGERRIGKTSFQHRLKKCLVELDDPDHQFFPVFIDLQGLPQEKFFATLAAEVFHELAPKLDGLQPQTPPGEDSYGYRELVKDLHLVLEALRKRSKKKVKLVLLIDEVDELNHYDPRINQRLRSLFMRAFADNLVAVVSGVSIKKQWERQGSPWYNFFQEIEVEPLAAEEAKALIEAPVRGVFSFAEGAAGEIIRRSHAKPYLIQRLCTALVDRMHAEHRQTISLADVDAACQIEGL